MNPNVHSRIVTTLTLDGEGGKGGYSAEAWRSAGCTPGFLLAPRSSHSLLIQIQTDKKMAGEILCETLRHIDNINMHSTLNLKCFP